MIAQWLEREGLSGAFKRLPDSTRDAVSTLIETVAEIAEQAFMPRSAESGRRGGSRGKRNSSQVESARDGNTARILSRAERGVRRIIRDTTPAHAEEAP